MVTTINKTTRYRDQLECTIGNLKFHFSPIFYFHPLGNFRKPKVFYLFQGVQKWSIGLKGVNVNGIASTQDLIRLSNKAFRLRVGLCFFFKINSKDGRILWIRSEICRCEIILMSVLSILNISLLAEQHCISLKTRSCRCRIYQ